MKVTALIPEEMIENLLTYSHAKNITEGLKMALQDWINLRKLQKLNAQLDKNPLQFQKGFSAVKVRQLNRKKS